MIRDGASLIRERMTDPAMAAYIREQAEDFARAALAAILGCHPDDLDERLVVDVVEASAAAARLGAFASLAPEEQ